MSLDLINLLVLLTATNKLQLLDGSGYTPGHVRHEAKHHAAQLEEAFNEIGTSMMQDDFACKLMAYTYVIGSEACVLHTGLHAGIMIAQQKLGIFGGCTPNVKLLPLMQQRIRELERGFKSVESSKFNEDIVPWVREIHDKYNLTFNPKKTKTKKKKS